MSGQFLDGKSAHYRLFSGIKLEGIKSTEITNITVDDKICFFDKSNAFKQLLNRRDREKTFHGYPVNGWIPKGHALKWVEVYKKHNTVDHQKLGTSVLCDSDQFQFAVYSESSESFQNECLLCVAVTTSGINSMKFINSTYTFSYWQQVENFRNESVTNTASMSDLLAAKPNLHGPACRGTSAAIDQYLLLAPDLDSKPAGSCCRSTGQTDGGTVG